MFWTRLKKVDKFVLNESQKSWQIRFEQVSKRLTNFFWTRVKKVDTSLVWTRFKKLDIDLVWTRLTMAGRFSSNEVDTNFVWAWLKNVHKFIVNMSLFVVGVTSQPAGVLLTFLMVFLTLQEKVLKQENILFKSLKNTIVID